MDPTHEVSCPAHTRLAPSVAVVIPCHNEAPSIAQVIRDFRKALPKALIVVADNASTDQTAQIAEREGAAVIPEMRLGKGRAVRRLFADVDADIYVLADGDGECDASVAPSMVAMVADGRCEMVIGKRIADEAERTYRPGHRLGNASLTWIFQKLFKLEITDTLSGYRVISRRLVKSLPSRAQGFEIEAELNAHSAVMDVNIAEVPTRFVGRPAGDDSKLSTVKDGTRILRLNLRLFRDARPSFAFTALAVPWFLATLWCAFVVWRNYHEAGTIISIPNLMGCFVFFMIGLTLLKAGITMERITRNRNEAVLLAYLAQPAPYQVSSMLRTPGRAHSTVVARQTIEVP